MKADGNLEFIYVMYVDANASYMSTPSSQIIINVSASSASELHLSAQQHAGCLKLRCVVTGNIVSQLGYRGQVLGLLGSLGSIHGVLLGVWGGRGEDENTSFLLLH